MVGNNHIIHQVFLEINTNNKEKAFEIKDNISLFLTENIFPGIESIFDNLDDKERIRRFEKIQLSVVVQNFNNKKEIGNKIVSKLYNIINESDKTTFEKTNAKITNTQNSISDTTNIELVFFHFLQTGKLPWFGNEEHINSISTAKTWEQKLSNTNFISELNKTLKTSEIIQERFVKQFPEYLVFNFLAKNSKINSKIIKNLQKWNSCFPLSIQHLFKLFCLKITLIRPEKNNENLLDEFQFLMLQIIQKQETFSNFQYPEFKSNFTEFIQKVNPKNYEFFQNIIVKIETEFNEKGWLRQNLSDFTFPEKHSKKAMLSEETKSTETIPANHYSE